MKRKPTTPKRAAWTPPLNPCGHTRPMHDGNDWHCIRDKHNDSHHYFVRNN